MTTRHTFSAVDMAAATAQGMDTAAAETADADATHAAPAALLDAVWRAWTEILPGPHDPASTWIEAGGDSLMTLHLLLGLERALGRKLSFDTIDPDMTAAELARALHSEPCGAPGLPPPINVFLIPGIFGDEPRLAAFRRSFEGRLAFQLIDPNDLAMSAALLADLPASGRFVAAAIDKVQADGELLLAGYSLGGIIALEASRHLVAQGRKVALLVILDSALEAQPPEPLRADRWLLRRLGSRDALRPWLLAAIRRLRPGKVLPARRQLLHHLRSKAMLRWQPAPVAAPVLLVASDDASAAMVDAWRDLGSEVEVVRMAATHHTLFDAPVLGLLTPAFERAVRERLSGMPTSRSARGAATVRCSLTGAIGVARDGADRAHDDAAGMLSSAAGAGYDA